jgi:HAD superfamily hydrolase (TIGR01450 family)
LKTILPESSSVLLVGSEGIHSELQRVGLQVIKQMEKAEFSDISIAAVVVGFDPNFNYQSISDAVSVFNSNPHAILVACNLDATFMGSEGKVRPGTGSLVSSIVCATGRQPIVMGKPNRFCFDALKDSCMDFDCEKAVFIGDRLDSDIAFGNACGMFSILVETGVHKRSDVCDKFIPKLIISNLSELHETNNNEL